MAVTGSEPAGAQPESLSVSALGDRRALLEELLCRIAEDEVLQSLSTYDVRSSLEQAVDLALRAVYRMLDTGAAPSETDLRGLGRPIAVLARHGISLDAILDMCSALFRTLLHRIEREMVVGSSEWESAVDLYGIVLEEVSVAYAHECRQGVSSPSSGTDALTRALTDGRPRDHVEQLAWAAGVSLAERYEVVAFSIGLHDNEERAESDSTSRRRLRSVRIQLGAVLSSPLATVGPDGGILLIPSSADVSTPDEVIERLRTSCRLVITAISESALVEEIPSVVHHASELLDLVRRLGYHPRVYPAETLAVEYQILRPGSARDHLASIAHELAEAPELIDTLRTLFDQELVRKHTAKRLFIHPNSLDYRLRRIAKLTGYDPAVPSDLRILRYALVAADAEGGYAACE